MAVGKVLIFVQIKEENVLTALEQKTVTKKFVLKKIVGMGIACLLKIPTLILTSLIFTSVFVTRDLQAAAATERVSPRTLHVQVQSARILELNVILSFLICEKNYKHIYDQKTYHAKNFCESIDPLKHCGRSLRSVHSSDDNVMENLISELDMYALETFIKFNPEDRVAELCPGKCFGFYEDKCFNNDNFKGFPGPYKFEGYAGWKNETDLQKERKLLPTLVECFGYCTETEIDRLKLSAVSYNSENKKCVCIENFKGLIERDANYVLYTKPYVFDKLRGRLPDRTTIRQSATKSLQDCYVENRENGNRQFSYNVKTLQCNTYENEFLDFEHGIFAGLDTTFYTSDYFTNGNTDTDNVQRVFDNCNGRYKRENCIGRVESPNNRPGGYLKGGIASITACQELCTATISAGQCVAFMYNADEKQCSMYINTDVDPDCGTVNPKYTWYDMRFFDNDPDTKNVLFEGNGVLQNTCENMCKIHTNCTGITYTKKGECALLREVTEEKVLCHETDVNDFTYHKSTFTFDATTTPAVTPPTTTLAPGEPTVTTSTKTTTTTTTTTILAVNSKVEEPFKYLKATGKDLLQDINKEKTLENCFDACNDVDDCESIAYEDDKKKCKLFESKEVDEDSLGDEGSTSVFYLKAYFDIFKRRKAHGTTPSKLSQTPDMTVQECYDSMKKNPSAVQFAYVVSSDTEFVKNIGICLLHDSFAIDRVQDPKYILYQPNYFEDEDGNQIVFENCNGAYIRHNCIGHAGAESDRPTNNRPDHIQNKTFDYLQDNIESLEACRDLCKSAPGDFEGQKCLAFAYNKNKNNGQCSMHIDTNVDNNCGKSTAGFTWYDMRYFEDDNEVGHGSLLKGTASSLTLSKIECEQECHRHASCNGITYTVTGECVLLKVVTHDKLLCHHTDVGSHTISLKASVPFNLLDSTFAHTTCHQFRENLPGTVGCESDKVIKDMTIVYSKGNVSQSCADGKDKDFTENTGCSGNSPGGLKAFALECCENRAKCTLSCSNSECQCVSSPEITPLGPFDDPCPREPKTVSVNVTCGDPPPPAQASASKSSTSSNGLSTGAIAGIAAGSAALVGLVVFRKKIKALFSSKMDGANFSQMIKL